MNDLPSYIHKAAKYYLVSIIFFLWGISSCLFKFFPYPQLSPYMENIKDWIDGSPYDVSDQKNNKVNSEQDLFPILHHTHISLSPLVDPHHLVKKSQRKAYYYSKAQEGYYIIYGELGLSEATYGAYVISAQGHLKHIIKRPAIHSKFKHLGQGGITDDGIFIFNSYHDLWVSDACSRMLFTVKSSNNRSSLLTHKGFHHKASGDQDDIWVLYTNQIRKYNIQNGKMTKKIHLMDIVKANKDLGVFEGRFKTILSKKRFRGDIRRWQYKNIFKELKVEDVTFFDPFHQNDVDVLTLDKEQYYPKFTRGDLLLSFRSLNIIMVIDPKSLRMKWYHFGGFSRQHDPDWSSHGGITLYDNQSHNKFSRIVQVNLNSKNPIEQIHTLLAGKSLNFYQFAEGNHHIDERGRIFFSNRNEAVQVDQNGKVLFYFHHKKSVKKVAKISEIRFISQKTYNLWFASCSR